MTYRMGGKMREQFPRPKADLSTAERAAEYQRAQQVLEPMVTNGLAHTVRQANGGGITAVYDRTRQRAYVQTSPR
jgi:hypothetical protein